MSARRLSARQLSAQLVRDRLHQVPEVDPFLASLMEEIELRPAAVLVPMLKRASTWHILFTRRSHKVSSHKGEISFPGGRLDPEDPDQQTAALRETHEEIGIAPQHIELFGRLPASFSIAGYRIDPFVGQLDPEILLTPSDHEIDEIFTVPLEELLAPGVLHLRNRVRTRHHEHDVYTFQWRPDYHIWGATARILKNFLEQLFGPLIVRAPHTPHVLELSPEAQKKLKPKKS